MDTHHFKETLMNGMLVALLGWLLAVGVSQAGPPTSGKNMVRNGDFERDTDGDGMADGWQFAGDAGVTATWERDAGFTGRFSQKLICTRLEHQSPASHAMLCQIDTVRLEKGRWYRIAFAARGEAIRGRTVHVAISNMNSWSNCGLNESFRISREWKRFEFIFQATQTISERVRLQFWYTTTGTFWLDDVRLEPSAPQVRRYTEELPPTTARNLLPNGSFECGTSGWGSIADLPGWGGNLNRLVGNLDTTTSRVHRTSFKIALTPETLPVFYFDYFPLYRVPVKAPLLANRGWIPVEPGTEYTLSAFMKADVEGLAGILSARQAFRGTLRRSVRLTADWQRVSFTFRPQADQIFVALGPDLEASGREAGTVWIDGVQLERGSSASPYRPRATVEVGLETGRLGNLFPYGTALEMEAIVFNADAVPHPVTLHWRTTDFEDAVAHESSRSVEVPPQGSVRVPIDPGVRRKGFYRLHLRGTSPEEDVSITVALTRPVRFAIIEPYARTDSLFGMNHAYPWPHLLDLSKQIGLGWFRDWSLKWHDVEPERGRFDFTEADFQIQRVLERGLHVLPLLPFPSSNWASSAGPEVGVVQRYPENRKRAAFMPRDLEDFARYVRETVRYFRDRLHAWEILNEPIYTDYALPRREGYQVEDYVRLLEVAFRAVKGVDPDALVIGGIAGGPTTYTREFIEAGGLRWVDALNLHIYPGLTDPEAYEEPLRELRQRMRAVGADKPIWFTEGAYYADDDTPVEPYRAWLKPLDSEREAAEWQVKFDTILLAYGVEKIIYHSGTPGSLNNESLSGIFFEWAGAPRKMVATQVAMANLLPFPLTSLGPISAPDGVKAYGFEGEGRTVLVAWLGEDAADPIELSLAGKRWRAFDIQGNAWPSEQVVLTEQPLYFIAEGTGIRQFPW